MPAAARRRPRDPGHRADRTPRPATATSLATGEPTIVRRPADVPGRALRGEAERPARAELLTSGTASWNAGTFVWRRDALIDVLDRHAPDIERSDRRLRSRRSERTSAPVYASLRATSIDYALLEPASVEGRVAVVPMSVGWSDLGSWAALKTTAAGDGRRERARRPGRGPSSTSAPSACFVHAGAGASWRSSGSRDLVIVDTPDALLICTPDAAQDVKASSTGCAPRVATTSSDRDRSACRAFSVPAAAVDLRVAGHRSAGVASSAASRWTRGSGEPSASPSACDDRRPQRLRLVRGEHVRAHPGASASSSRNGRQVGGDDGPPGRDPGRQGARGRHRPERAERHVGGRQDDPRGPRRGRSP